MAKTDPELTRTLEAIQQALAALTDRVVSLEARLGAAAAGGVLEDAAAGEASAPTRPTEAAVPELTPTDGAGRVRTSASQPGAVASDEIAPDVLLAIAAAVAAYLGERAHIRQIRLISSAAWGQQGRVNVQASHTLHR